MTRKHLNVAIYCDSNNPTFIEYLPGTILWVSYVFIHLIITAILWGRYCYYPHFTSARKWRHREVKKLVQGHAGRVNGRVGIWAHAVWHILPVQYASQLLNFVRNNEFLWKNSYEWRVIWIKNFENPLIIASGGFRFHWFNNYSPGWVGQ